MNRATIKTGNNAVINKLREMGLEVKKCGPGWFNIKGDPEVVKLVEFMDGVKKFAFDKVIMKF